MKRVFWLWTALCLLFAGAAWAQTDATAWARATVEDLQQGRFEAVYERSDAQMHSALGSAEGMEQMWLQLSGMLGEASEVQYQDGGVQSGLLVAYVRWDSQISESTLVFSFSDDGLLCGIGLLEQKMKAAQATLAPGCVEEQIALRPGQADESGGRLTLPEGDGPFPAVILVPGSGPADMDETMLSNAPLRDLAYGLALRGIASIRYDKYTYAHPQLSQRADFTVEDEYVQDALAAANLLAADARVDKIYLLGHSQGAMLAPRIMAALQKSVGQRLAGGILLAGSPMHLWEIQYHQNLRAVALLDEDQRAAAQDEIAQEVEKIALFASLDDVELQKQTLFGINAYYQLDEMRVDAVETAVCNALPLFIAQGAQDWQVTLEDGLEGWRARLPEDFAATYVVYENMNHLLSEMAGEATGTALDYADPDARVSPALIEDIAKWIAAQ